MTGHTTLLTVRLDGLAHLTPNIYSDISPFMGLGLRV